MTNQTVLITGAGSGIGKALAHAFKNENANLILVDKNPSFIDSLRSEISEDRNFVITKVMDVADIDAVSQFQREIEKKQIVVDVLIANAGISKVSHPDCLTEELLHEIMNVNFFGTTNFVLSFLPAMRKRKNGHIVVTSSLAGVRGLPGSAAYCASKAAQATFIESLRIDLRKENIKFTTFFPGFVDTPINLPLEGLQKTPFKISPEKAANIMMRAIKKQRRTKAFPVIPALLGYFARFLSSFTFDLLMRRHVIDFGESK